MEGWSYRVLVFSRAHKRTQNAGQDLKILIEEAQSHQGQVPACNKRIELVIPAGYLTRRLK